MFCGVPREARGGDEVTTLANVRAALRRVLEDTDAAAYLWTDAELNDWLRTSLDGYSRQVPQRTSAVIMAFAGLLYALPSEPLAILSVEWQGAAVPRRSGPIAPSGSALSWWPAPTGPLFSQVLTSGGVTVWYECRWPFPVADGDDFGIQPDGDNYLVWGAAVLAWERRQIASAKRRGNASGESAALRLARETFAEMRRRVRKAQSGALTLAE